MVGGVAERCVIGRGITVDEALAEIGECLAQLPRERRAAAVTHAAVGYVNSGRHGAAAVLQLLVRAGADPDRARELAVQPRHGFQVGGR